MKDQSVVTTATKPFPNQDESWSLEITPRSSLFYLPVRDVWQFRDLLVLFVRRDFVAFYKQTILGPIWFFIQPLLTTLIYMLVFGRIAKLSTDGLPQILFYLCGVTFWNYFAECFNKTATVFKDNANLFGKVYFPRMIIPLSIVVSNLIRFGVQFVMFFVILGWFLFHGSSVTSTKDLTVVGTSNGPLVISNDDNSTSTQPVINSASDGPFVFGEVPSREHRIVLATESKGGAVSLVDSTSGNPALMFDPGQDFDHLLPGEQQIVSVEYIVTGPVRPNATVLLFPLLVAIMATLGLGLGMLFSAMTTKYRDLVFLLQFGVQLMMYATPVIYPFSQIPARFQGILAWNPLMPILEAVRYGFLGAGNFQIAGLIYSAVFSIVTFLLASVVFNRVEKTFMDTV